MSPIPTTVLVLGATGVQGTAVIKSLVAAGTSQSPITIHAFVRDPCSPASTTLKSLSTPNTAVTLCPGTFDDPASLRSAAHTCTAAFLNFKPSMNPPDPNIELTHARNTLAALSNTPTIKRVVYTSIANLRDPSLPESYKSIVPNTWMYNLFHTKHQIQELLKAAAKTNAWSYTILGLGSFLSNFLPPLVHFTYPVLSQLGRKEIVTAFPRGHLQCYVDMADVGSFATAMFTADDDEVDSKWNRRILNFASENCAFEDVIEGINEALGLDGEERINVRFMERGEAEERAKSDLLVQSQIALVENQMLVDTGVLKEFGIPMGGVSAFFERNKVALRETVAV